MRRYEQPLMFPRSTPSRVLIVGGYGKVGGQIARFLSSELGERLVIGGHNELEAYRFAQSLDTNAHWRFIDVEDSTSFNNALDGVTLLVICMDTKTLDLAYACIERGIHYVDITASIEVIDRLKTANEMARNRRVLLLSSVGLAPGLTSLLAKACVLYSPEPVSSVSIHILLGLREQHGKAALGWMVDRLYQPFWVGSGTHKERRVPYVKTSKVQFSGVLGQRKTYQIDLSDQHTLPDTLNIPNASTWLTLDVQWMANLLSIAARVGILRWAKYPWIRRFLVQSFRSLSVGSDQFAVTVESFGSDSGRRTTCSAAGFGEAHATAIIAAETVRYLLVSSIPEGARQLEEILDLGWFVSTLTEHGIHVSAHPDNLTNDPRKQEESVNGINLTTEQHY